MEARLEGSRAPNPARAGSSSPLVFHPVFDGYEDHNQQCFNPSPQFSNLWHRPYIANMPHLAIKGKNNAHTFHKNFGTVLKF
jgi:hypothetical protein